MPDPRTRVTLLLRAIGDGDDGARERLFELLYAELRQVASGHVARGAPRGTLQATALVNEAYLRLAGKPVLGEDRRHFFFAASRAMRDVLVENARKKAAQIRGGHLKREGLEGLALSLDTAPEDVLALNDALERLEQADARSADVVRLRFFAGLSEAETAETLGLSVRTVSRVWGLARADLALWMRPTDPG